ncbi:MAG: hypothetical protein P8Y70_16830 [Candidatus Lokiarchaeota archaeon]
MKECINLLNNRDDIFAELIGNNLIYENQAIVYLFSDVRFVLFFPKYIINKLISRFEKQEISSNEYFTHLKLLLSRMENFDGISYEIV